MNQSTPANQLGQPTLLRGINRWALVAVAINGVIGGGIFGLPGRVYALIGPYSLLAFVACALIITLIVLCFAEVSSRFAETGGPYLYARATFGAAVGFEVGWLIWLARVTAFAANCNLLIEYLSYFQPGVTAGWPRTAAISTIVAALTVVNVIGVRDAARVSSIATIGKLALFALFIVTGLFFLDAQNFAPVTPPTFANSAQAVLLLVYAFTGFENAIIPAGEVRDPQRNVPFSLLTTIGVVTVLYILIQVVCIGTLPELATSQRPLADAGSRFLGASGAAVMAAGAVVSLIGNLSVVMLAGARLPFAMASQRELPRIFAATHPRFRTPHVAIWLTGAVMLALTLSGTFIYAVTVSTIARLLAYATTCVGLPILRRRNQPSAAQFKVPGGGAIAIVSLALIAWLLSHSTPREARDAALATAAGLVIYAVYRLKRRASATAS